MYKRFRIIKKEREKNEGEREDIGEIEKLKKVLLNKLLLLIDKYSLCSDKTFMKYESLVKNTFTEDYSLQTFLLFPSFFFYSTSNVLGNFQLNNSFYKQIVSVSDVLITCYKQEFAKMKALNT